jgi:hypothetical protein
METTALDVEVNEDYRVIYYLDFLGIKLHSIYLNTYTKQQFSFLKDVSSTIGKKEEEGQGISRPEISWRQQAQM